MLDVVADAIPEAVASVRGRGGAAEDCLVDIFGSEVAGAADDDAIAFLDPFEHGARADAEFAADIHWNGDLTLGGDAGSSESHSLCYRGNG